SGEDEHQKASGHAHDGVIIREIPCEGVDQQWQSNPGESSQQEDDAHLDLWTSPLTQLVNFIIDEFLAARDVVHFGLEYGDENQPGNNGKDDGYWHAHQHPLAEADDNAVGFLHVASQQSVWRGTNQGA